MAIQSFLILILFRVFVSYFLSILSLALPGYDALLEGSKSVANKNILRKC